MVQCINHKNREASGFHGTFGNGIHVCRECYQYYARKDIIMLFGIGKDLVLLISICLIVLIVMDLWRYI